MYLITLLTIETTYILTELNEWDSAHSYYKREAKIAPQYNLKVRKTDQLKQLNFIYTSNCIIGGIILMGVAGIVTLMVSSNVMPVIILPALLAMIVITLIITNMITTLSDNAYDKHLHLLTLVKSKVKNRKK